MKESLEAQTAILESLKVALKGKAAQVDEGHALMLAVSSELGIDNSSEESSIAKLCSVVEERMNQVTRETEEAVNQIGIAKSDRAEKENAVDLLSERAARADAAAKKFLVLEMTRDELKSKVECQAFVLDSLRDRINFLERPRADRSLRVEAASPLFGVGGEGRRICNRLKRCLWFSR